MEPALIYAASEKIKYQVKWTRVTTDTEWRYIGSGAELNTALLQQIIDETFPQPSIVVAIDRQQSFTTTTDRIINEIKTLIGRTNLIIWDSGFTTAIECNAIGVARCGRI